MGEWISVRKAKSPLMYVGDENEVSTSSSTPVDLKEFHLVVTPTIAVYEKLLTQAELKVSQPGCSVFLQAFFDGETNPRCIVSSDALTYTVGYSPSVSIKDLAQGAHEVSIKLNTTTEGLTVYNKTLEFYLTN